MLVLNNNDILDLKKFIPGEGSGKDFLKSEVDRMIGILSKKQECGHGVHVFKRVEPGAKVNPNAVNHAGTG
jgi:hypothetical protein